MIAGLALLALATTSEPTSLLVLSAGRMNMANPDEGPMDGGAEYRFAPMGRWKLIPAVGVTIAEEGAGYAYAALHYDFRLGQSWYLTPELGAGAFRNGGNLDLGFWLEFRTGIELSYRFEGGARLGVLGYHMSNASLSSDNPGTEAVELLFAWPIGRR